MCDIAISDVPTSNKTRHVSIRLPDELYERLEALAAEHDETVSQCARRLLDRGSASSTRPATALDDAIAALQLVRNSVAVTAPHEESEPVADPSPPTDPPPAAPAAPRPPTPAASPTASPVGDLDRAPPAPPTPSRPAREVNVHNAKSNLSRLLADVGRGEEIVIVHAGAPRARLVAVDGDDRSRVG